MERKTFGMLLALLLLLTAPNTFADLQPFPGLKTVSVPRLFGVVPNLEPMNIRVHYDPALTTLINKRHRSEGGWEEIEVLTTKIDRKSNQHYTVYYSPGPSGDPSFGISLTGTETAVGGFPGLELFIPGNGAVYVMGHTNNYFNAHRKFVLESGKLVETKQPFYHVGLESRAKRDIIIFRDKTEKEVVATIPSGGKLTVVLNDGDNFYLIKTPFGLVGWARYQIEYGDNFIEGLFFKGD